jgi:poly-gamma-glutamate capsule biosynthesis protein CapA/YwtB (metallophosphatase superfamily)
VGTPADFSDQGVLRIRDQRIALLGWCDRPRQYAPDTPPYNELSDHVYEQIRIARRRSDMVVASVHWGDEFILVPTERERRIAREMIDAGACCVIGHHPHVLREVERYRHGLIAYSLGNFIGDMTWNPRTRLSAWLTVEVDADRIVSDLLTPALIEDDYFPRRLPEHEARVRIARLTAEARADAAKVARAGYGHIAEKTRKRHVQHTVWMMLRNLRRYPGEVKVDVFRGALSHRIRALLPRI